MSSIPLTERDRHMLTMAGARYKHQGARESEIGQLVNLTATAFYQRVAQLADTEAALAWNPMLIRRLRDARGSREHKFTRLGALL